MDKNVDFRKVFKEFYLPPAEPHIVNIPEMTFIAVNGCGAPEGEKYQQAVSVLYTLSYAIRTSYKNGNPPDGFFKYTVPPLEGIWEIMDGCDPADRDRWQWTSLIMQPEFVDKRLFQWALQHSSRKHKELDFSRAILLRSTQRRCVQMMHHGPYSTETESFALMGDYMCRNGLEKTVKAGIATSHREIYLNDPRRTAPEKLLTVLRINIKE